MAIYVDDSEARYLPDEQKWLCGSCIEGDPMGNADDPGEELGEMIFGAGEWPRGSTIDCADCGAMLAHDA